MPLPVKSPEQLKADRVAREAREKENAEEHFSQQRARVAGGFLIAGLVLLLIGAWFLLVDPTVAESVVNLQKLYVGQTSAIVGSILLATGAALKYLA